MVMTTYLDTLLVRHRFAFLMRDLIIKNFNNENKQSKLQFSDYLYWHLPAMGLGNVMALLWKIKSFQKCWPNFNFVLQHILNSKFLTRLT